MFSNYEDRLIRNAAARTGAYRRLCHEFFTVLQRMTQWGERARDAAGNTLPEEIVRAAKEAIEYLHRLEAEIADEERREAEDYRRARDMVKPRPWVAPPRDRSMKWNEAEMLQQLAELKKRTEQ
jgi:hypothetical protein